MAVEEKNNNRTLLLEEQRHKEKIDAIKGLVNVISNANKNEAVAKAIEGNTKEIGNFGKALSDLEVKVDAPIVNVKTDLSELSKEIKEMKEGQLRIEKLLMRQNEIFEEMCKPKDYDFEFSRNQWGAMQSPIKARAKPMSKPKAQA